MPLFMDHALARRLERAEGRIGASFAPIRQRLAPEVGVISHDFDGTYAMFDGADSPWTQTFGLGMFGAVTKTSLAAIEAFFETRGAAATHEVSPLAGIQTIALLVERGYQPVELGTVLVQALDDSSGPAAPISLRTRRIDEADHRAWVDASIAGWTTTSPELAGVIGQVANTAVQNQAMVHFVVERDGAAIATASLGVHDRVALLAGASTIPSGRGLGAQGALLVARLDEARRLGCDLAMMVSEPGSTSQRNAERRGFRVAYTRTKWRQTPLGNVA